jgi:hypothetical protein
MNNNQRDTTPALASVMIRVMVPLDTSVSSPWVTNVGRLEMKSFQLGKNPKCLAVGRGGLGHYYSGCTTFEIRKNMGSILMAD